MHSALHSALEDASRNNELKYGNHKHKQKQRRHGINNPLLSSADKTRVTRRSYILNTRDHKHQHDNNANRRTHQLKYFSQINYDRAALRSTIVNTSAPATD